MSKIENLKIEVEEDEFDLESDNYVEEEDEEEIELDNSDDSSSANDIVEEYEDEEIDLDGGGTVLEELDDYTNIDVDEDDDDEFDIEEQVNLIIESHNILEDLNSVDDEEEVDLEDKIHQLSTSIQKVTSIKPSEKRKPKFSGILRALYKSVSTTYLNVEYEKLIEELDTIKEYIKNSYIASVDMVSEEQDDTHINTKHRKLTTSYSQGSDDVINNSVLSLSLQYTPKFLLSSDNKKLDYILRLIYCIDDSGSSGMTLEYAEDLDSMKTLVDSYVNKRVLDYSPEFKSASSIKFVPNMLGFVQAITNFNTNRITFSLSESEIDSYKGYFSYYENKAIVDKAISVTTLTGDVVNDYTNFLLNYVDSYCELWDFTKGAYENQLSSLKSYLVEFINDMKYWVYDTDENGNSSINYDCFNLLYSVDNESIVNEDYLMPSHIYTVVSSINIVSKFISLWSLAKYKNSISDKTFDLKSVLYSMPASKDVEDTLETKRFGELTFMTSIHYNTKNSLYRFLPRKTLNNLEVVLSKIGDQVSQFNNTHLNDTQKNQKSVSVDSRVDLLLLDSGLLPPNNYSDIVHVSYIKVNNNLINYLCGNKECEKHLNDKYQISDKGFIASVVTPTDNFSNKGNSNSSLTMFNLPVYNKCSCCGKYNILFYDEINELTNTSLGFEKSALSHIELNQYENSLTLNLSNVFISVPEHSFILDALPYLKPEEDFELLDDGLSNDIQSDINTENLNPIEKLSKLVDTKSIKSNSNNIPDAITRYRNLVDLFKNKEIRDVKVITLNEEQISTLKDFDVKFSSRDFSLTMNKKNKNYNSTADSFIDSLDSMLRDGIITKDEIKDSIIPSSLIDSSTEVIKKSSNEPSRFLINDSDIFNESGFIDKSKLKTIIDASSDYVVSEDRSSLEKPKLFVDNNSISELKTRLAFEQSNAIFRGSCNKIQDMILEDMFLKEVSSSTVMINSSQKESYKIDLDRDNGFNIEESVDNLDKLVKYYSYMLQYDYSNLVDRAKTSFINHLKYYNIERYFIDDSDSIQLEKSILGNLSNNILTVSNPDKYNDILLSIISVNSLVIDSKFYNGSSLDISGNRKYFSDLVNNNIMLLDSDSSYVDNTIHSLIYLEPLLGAIPVDNSVRKDYIDKFDRLLLNDNMYILLRRVILLMCLSDMKVDIIDLLLSKGCSLLSTNVIKEKIVYDIKDNYVFESKQEDEIIEYLEDNDSTDENLIEEDDYSYTDDMEEDGDYDIDEDDSSNTYISSNSFNILSYQQPENNDYLNYNPILHVNKNDRSVTDIVTAVNLLANFKSKRVYGLSKSVKEPKCMNYMLCDSGKEFNYYLPMINMNSEQIDSLTVLDLLNKSLLDNDVFMIYYSVYLVYKECGFLVGFTAFSSVVSSLKGMKSKVFDFIEINIKQASKDLGINLNLIPTKYATEESEFKYPDYNSNKVNILRLRTYYYLKGFIKGFDLNSLNNVNIVGNIEQPFDIKEFKDLDMSDFGLLRFSSKVINSPEAKDTLSVYLNSVESNSNNHNTISYATNLDHVISNNLVELSTLSKFYYALSKSSKLYLKLLFVDFFRVLSITDTHALLTKINSNDSEFYSAVDKYKEDKFKQDFDKFNQLGDLEYIPFNIEDYLSYSTIGSALSIVSDLIYSEEYIEEFIDSNDYIPREYINQLIALSERYIKED